MEGGSAPENLALQNIQARLRMVIAFLFAQLTPWVRGRAGFLLVLGSANVDEGLRCDPAAHGSIHSPAAPERPVPPSVQGLPDQVRLQQRGHQPNRRHQQGGHPPLPGLGRRQPRAALACRGERRGPKGGCRDGAFLGLLRRHSARRRRRIPARGVQVEAAPPTAELEPLKDGAVAQLDEVDMGMTYDELSVFGRLRKVRG